MALIVTPLYAGLLGLLLFALSAKVIKARLRSGVSIGDGSDAALAHAIWAQGNFTEYAPMGVVLLALVELQGAPFAALHALGAALFLGRALHAYGLTHRNDLHPARKIGIVLTFSSIVFTSLGLLGHALF